MAKKSMLARHALREKLVKKGRVLRLALCEIISSPSSSYEDKMLAVTKLNKRSRDESACRVKNRCRRCGRPRAIYSRFALCRICLRQTAMHGDVPGLTKASW